MVPAEAGVGYSEQAGGESGRLSDRTEERTRYRLTKSQRLRSSLDFEQIYAGQQRVGDGFLLLFGRRSATDITRIGLSVSRKHGNAVRRNRLKRLLRDAFRLSQHDLPPGLDLILIPRQNSNATRDDLCRSLIALSRRLAKRLPTESPS